MNVLRRPGLVMVVACAGSGCNGGGRVASPSDASIAEAGGADLARAPVIPSCDGLPAACGPVASRNCCASERVAGGTFYRDYDGTVDYLDVSYPATVSDFDLDTYEITVGRFRKFIAANMGTQMNPPVSGSGRHPAIEDSGWDSSWNSQLAMDAAGLLASIKAAPLCTYTDTPAGNENRPMNCISWYEAFAFCAWDGGRLPTEAEWTYAAAGGAAQRAYPWSVPSDDLTIDGSFASYGDNTGGECYGDGQSGCALTDLVPVGSKPKGNGRYGQADLAGNVTEWTMDSDLGAIPVPCVDCAAVGTDYHIARGGSFGSGAGHVRTAYRANSYRPEARGNTFGARCARNR